MPVVLSPLPPTKSVTVTSAQENQRSLWTAASTDPCSPDTWLNGASSLPSIPVSSSLTAAPP